MSKAQLEQILQMSAKNPPPENATPEAMRSWWEATMAATPVVEGCRIERVGAGPLGGDLVRAPGSDGKDLIIFYHGGGFIFGSSRSHRVIATHLSRVSGGPVLAADYRLAPAAHDDAFATYEWALANGYSPKTMTLCGDSAGGNLALATALRARDRGLALPGALALYSPAVDLANEGETFKTLADAPLLTPELMRLVAMLYVGGGDAKARGVSPLYADFRGLPPTLIHVGSWEILLSDSSRLAEAMRKAGVRVELKVWDGMCHDWQLFAPFLDEGLKSIEETATFIRAAR